MNVGSSLSTPGVYAITCLSTGDRYVGSSNNVTRRWGQHRDRLRNGKGSNPWLQQAWSKYGPSDFVIEMLERVDDVALLKVREAYYIQALRPEYNVQPIHNEPRVALSMCAPQSLVKHVDNIAPDAIARTIFVAHAIQDAVDRNTTSILGRLEYRAEHYYEKWREPHEYSVMFTASAPARLIEAVDAIVPAGWRSKFIVEAFRDALGYPRRRSSRVQLRLVRS